LLELVVLVGVLWIGGPILAHSQEIYTPPGEGSDERPADEPQTQRGPSVLAQPGSVDAETYLLGPGDVLEILLWGTLNRRFLATVDPEGLLFLPDVGVLPVSGRSLASARGEILARYARVLTRVQIEVRLARIRPQIVYVAGEVVRPGSYEATGVSRASEILQLAGGLHESASRRNILIARRGGDTLRVDLTRFERTGDLAANPFLSGGDVIVVPSREAVVFAFGAVHAPGRYEQVRGETVADLVHVAGGLRPEALPGESYLVRFRSATELDTLPLAEGALYGTADFLLEDGDRIFVGRQGEWKSPKTAVIQGEVARPGHYPVDERTLRISDLVALAGGLLPAADSGRVRLFRSTPVRTTAFSELERLGQLSRSQMSENEYDFFRSNVALQNSVFLIDLNRIRSGDRSLDVLLEDRDSVVVIPLSDAVRIDGEVRYPGLVRYRPDWSLADYVNDVGGYSDRAWKGRARIQRGGEMLRAKDVKEIHPGDLVWVPEKKESNFWAVVRDIAVVAASIAAVVAVATSN
jgi:protein involved in polysaccharide export with SLBB domain